MRFSIEQIGRIIKNIECIKIKSTTYSVGTIVKEKFYLSTGEVSFLLATEFRMSERDFLKKIH